MTSQISCETVRIAISGYYTAVYQALETLNTSLFQAKQILDSIELQEADQEAAYNESNRIWREMLELKRQASIEEQSLLDIKKREGALALKSQIGSLIDRLEAFKPLARSEHDLSQLKTLPELDFFRDPELYSDLFSGATDYRYFPSFEVREVLSSLQKSVRRPLEDALESALVPYQAAVQRAQEEAVPDYLDKQYQQAVTKLRDLQAEVEARRTALTAQYRDQRRIAIEACGQELFRLRAVLEATLVDLLKASNESIIA
ncbi:MAG: hypothetical protein IAF58_19505 [Leptolyngbya sp.]|nr:hypothetical protein [Candidatus Melainabacteria bacterium]